MNKPFQITVGGVDVELGGNTVVFDKDNRVEDQPGEFLNYFEHEGGISQTENYAVLGGQPANGVTVEVLEHTFWDKTMTPLSPFASKNGVSKFSSRNDIYVVFSKDGAHRIYVVCHRDFATGVVFWDAGPRKKLPAEKSRTQLIPANDELSQEQNDKIAEDQSSGRKSDEGRNRRPKHEARPS